MSVDNAPSWEALVERARMDHIDLERPSIGSCRLWSATLIRSILAEVRAVDLEDADMDIVCRAGVAALLSALRGIT